jgi:hypothetical protein
MFLVPLGSIAGERLNADSHETFEAKGKDESTHLSTLQLGRFGYVQDADLFPAISSDLLLLAILQITDPHEPSTYLNIYRRDDFELVQRFALFDHRELYTAQNAVNQYEALEAFYSTTQQVVNTANDFLSEQRFRPIDLLYDLHDWLHQPRSIERGNEDPDVWRVETAKWSLSFAPATDVFRIRSTETTETVFSVRPPIEVYGIARPGLLCRVRPRPYRGWYDSAAEVLILRFGYFSGLASCDIGDKWMLQRLENQ